MSLSWKDVTIAIPTMPQRRTLCGRLVARLSKQCEGAAIVVREHREGDPAKVDFPALVTAVLAITPKTWTLFVEDDVWTCDEFGPRALAYLQRGVSGDGGVDAVSFFSRSNKDAAVDPGNWRVQGPASFCMMQAIAVRTDRLPGFPAFAPGWYAEHPEHTHAADLLLAAWMSKNRCSMRVVVPSLVQHLDGPSTLPGHNGVRQSHSYRIAFGEVPS